MLPDQKEKNVLLPAEIVLAAQWWYRNENISFDRNFFYHPLKRVDIIDQDPDQIRKTITNLVEQSKDLSRTGICCINMDEKVSDEKIVLSSKLSKN